MIHIFEQKIHKKKQQTKSSKKLQTNDENHCLKMKVKKLELISTANRKDQILLSAVYFLN